MMERLKNIHPIAAIVLVAIVVLLVAMLHFKVEGAGEVAIKAAVGFLALVGILSPGQRAHAPVDPPGASSVPPPSERGALTLEALAVVVVAGFVVAAILVFAATLSGCAWFPSKEDPPGLPPVDRDRAAVRAALEVSTKALNTLDDICAEIVLRTKNRELGERCAAAYDASGEAIRETAAVVDAWSTDTPKSVVCTVGKLATAVDRMAAVVKGGGGVVPPVVTDARKLALAMGVCRE